MAKWYFQIDGEQFGPVEPAVLKRIATSGRLKPQDKVRREDSKEWHLAKQVQGLFNIGQNQPPLSPATPATVTMPAAPTAAATSAATDPTKWYYIVDGQEVGPLELADLKRLAAEGRLQPTQQLRQANASQSKSAQQLLPGLFVASDRTAEKPTPKKPNRVLIYALGCLAVPVGGFVLLFIAGLIVGATNPESQKRVKSPELSSSASTASAGFTLTDRPHAVTVDTTNLSDEARTYFENGADFVFTNDSVEGAALWAETRLNQLQLARQSGNELIVHEVQRAFDNEMTRLVGMNVNWKLRVAGVTATHVEFRGRGYGSEQFLVAPKLQYGGMHVEMEIGKNIDRARGLKAGNAVNITAKVADIGEYAGTLQVVLSNMAFADDLGNDDDEFEIKEEKAQPAVNLKVDEFRARIIGRDFVPKSSFYDVFGNPASTTTVGSDTWLIYKCQDGIARVTCPSGPFQYQDDIAPVAVDQIQ